MPQTVVVLGARNLGGAIIDHFLALGWNAAGVARSEETLDRVRTAGALALQADASAPQTLASALERARRELGSLDAVVNALSASRPPARRSIRGRGTRCGDVEAGWWRTRRIAKAANDRSTSVPIAPVRWLACPGLTSHLPTA